MYTIMYHRILNDKLEKKGYKGLGFDEFTMQLDYFKNNFDIENHMRINKKGNKQSVILTFDDGYAEHFQVAQMLANQNINATFFISSNIFNNIILPTHIIQYILSISDEDIIFTYLCEQLKFYQKKYHLDSINHYTNRILLERTWDTNKTLIIKRLLQRDL